MAEFLLLPNGEKEIDSGLITLMETFMEATLGDISLCPQRISGWLFKRAGQTA